MTETCLLISTFNRSSLLEKSLQRLADGRFTLPDEILVIDDGGDDDCEATCQRIPEIRDRIRYIYTHNPERSICCHARNVGLKNTDAQYVIISEPEILFETDVIAQMLYRRLGHPKEIVSAGTVHHIQSNDTIQTTYRWSATWCVMYKRAWLLEIGGYDENPDGFKIWGHEDNDLCTRLRIAGYGHLIDEEIVCTHQYHDPVQIDQGPNENYFRSKNFDAGDMTYLVANKNNPWGEIKPR